LLCFPPERLASEYKLHPVYKQEFHQVYEENQQHPEFQPLMVKMKVVDAKGESAMTEDQWEAASAFIALDPPRPSLTRLNLQIYISLSRSKSDNIGVHRTCVKAVDFCTNAETPCRFLYHYGLVVFLGNTRVNLCGLCIIAEPLFTRRSTRRIAPAFPLPG
jgi:uncharacterized Rmd1/YagE family protein